ncbi:hypothetical protein B0J13DRAFT_454339 [Dactylonectria estremocensis]|uniref:Uncharacterized protein n=1 Tax=Dactylonectria estremocensis TaxID=1079267 RepID=A0A9P9ILB5_9HYPO|nr:hypothetical protein B0J13DRAFT_454339 [Dactylonectria estremocensis]
MGLDSFLYNQDHRVVVCRPCGTCLVPKATSWKSHLRAELHRMGGDELRLTVELFLSYDLRPVEELRQWRADKTRPCWLIDGLTVFNGYYYIYGDCSYGMRRIAKMHNYMLAHRRKAS